MYVSAQLHSLLHTWYQQKHSPLLPPPHDADIHCVFAQELPGALGRALERELDDILPTLLKKAGELSTAGVALWLQTPTITQADEMPPAVAVLYILSLLTGCCRPNGSRSGRGQRQGRVGGGHV